MKNRKLLPFFTWAKRSTSKFEPYFSVQIHTLSDVNHVTNANIYSSNRIISNLMKSGSLSAALKLFDGMPERDVISWNIMISGYYRYGFLNESSSLYRQMVFQGFVENSSTFSTVLSLCSCARLFSEGLVVHCRAIVLGFSTNVYIGSALVDLYMKMGLSDIALRLFSSLQERNLATWNVVLRGVCETGRSRQMLKMYTDMKLDGLEPNGLTFSYLFQGCGYERLLEEGLQFHCCVIKNGLDVSNLFVSNALVDFYSACGCYIETKKSFDVIPSKDVISWNSMISVSAAKGYSFDALEIFRQMHFWGKKPSLCSFLGFLKSTKDASFGKQVHCFILKLGLNNILIQSALINMYGICNDLKSSVCIFDNLPERTIECCNPLMTSLLKYGLIEDVIELFCLMVDENMGYDEVTLSSTLKALSVSHQASSTPCSLLHTCAIKSGFDSDVAVTCSLIDAYSRTGEVKFFRHLLEQVSSPNTFCYTSVISGLARNGMGMKCIEMLYEMIKIGLKPDEVTFLSVLTGCSYSGLVEEGRYIFYSMRNYGLKQERRHYSCMVDILGRAGLLDEAEELLKDTPWERDYVIWSCLLRSCRVHGNEEVGRRAAKMVVDLEPENPSGWLQASAFYCDIGDFESMEECREIAVARKVRRDIGQSLIEVRHHL